MFRTITTAALTVYAALFPVTSASAQSYGKSLDRWVGQVNRQLDTLAEQPRGKTWGTARITFRRGADGRPTDVVVRAGNAAIAEAGVKTVMQLRKLPKLPAGFSSQQRITFNFLVGKADDIEYRNRRSQMLASANVANTQLAGIVGSTQVASLDRR